MKKNYLIIDIVKLLLALGIVAIHTGFLLNYNAGFYIHTILFRIGVPFFFFSSGYFLAFKTNNNNKKDTIKKQTKKLLIIYLFLSFVYLIINMVRYNDFNPSSILYGLWYIFTGRSQSVMWFVGALITSMIFLYFIPNNEVLKKSIIIAVVLYIIGLLFNTYNFLIIDSKQLSFIYYFLVDIFINNSNALFEGFLFVALGYYINKYGCKKNAIISIMTLIVGLLILFFEVYFVKQHLNVVNNYEYYLSHLLIIPSLFVLLTKINLNTDSIFIRKLSSYIYYFHYATIILLILFNNIYNTNVLNDNLGFYLMTILITTCFSILFYIYNMNYKEENLLKKYFIFLLYTVTGIIIIFSILTLFNRVIWADEICSLAMIRNGFKDIFIINSFDVHPPLYYCALKVFVGVTRRLLPMISLVTLSRFFSFLPLLLMLTFINTKMRKQHGDLFAAIVSLFFVSMSQIPMYFFEIRMYSWGLTIISIAYYYAMETYISNKKWVLLTIISIMATYIHFYSCLTMAFIYLLLLIYSYINKRYLTKKYLISGIIVSLCFIPWLIILIKNLGGAVDGFWIQPITIETIKSYIRNIFYPDSQYLFLNSSLGISFIVILIYIMVDFFKNNRKNKNNLVNSFGVIILLFVLLIAFIVSYLIKPLFVYGYAIFALGIFWISIGYILNLKILEKPKYLLVLLLPVTIGIISNTNFIRTEVEKEKLADTFYNNIFTLEKNDIIISNDVHTEFLVAYFLSGNKVFLYNHSNAEHMIKMYHNIDNINDKMISNYINKGLNIYYLELVKDDNQNEIDKLSIDNELILINSFSEDWYYMNLYKLEVRK